MVCPLPVNLRRIEMARLSSLNIGNLPPFVKPEVVASWDHFTVVGATSRASNLEPDVTEVVFLLLFDGMLHTMTQKMTIVRQQYVDYFAQGGEPITNLRLVKSAKAMKGGNKAWVFQDDGSEESDLIPDLEYVRDESSQGDYPDERVDLSDIPF